MIPKKIHYCWFGRGEKPKLAKRCIASWKKYCPDYEIIEWNEDNFDIAAYPYAAYCYRQRKWAFLSDFVRLVVVEAHGGLYFDTDVELVRKPDFLLEHEAFFGFENDMHVATGLGFGAVPHHGTIVAMLNQYLRFEPDSIGNFPIICCPALNTAALVELGLQCSGRRQTVAGAEIYPAEYFNPYESSTGRLRRTKETVSIHWYSMSWLSKSIILRTKITRVIHRIFGEKCFEKIKLCLNIFTTIINKDCTP